MKIKQDVLGVLSALAISGNGTRVRIVEQLDRKLYTETNKVLEALGGKWSRSDKAHVFPADVGERMEATILAGEIRTSADLGFFATPSTTGAALIRFVGGIDKTHRVLEPSAGEGALVRTILDAGASGPNVVACEIDEARAARLRSEFSADGVAVIHGDFLAAGGSGNDRVIMNPPFGRKVKAATGGDWMDHVRHAFTFLRSGGVLASIVPGGIEFRRDREHEAFKAWVLDHHGEIQSLPAQSFTSSGTNVNTSMIRMVHP